jgi:2,3-bisphosphoglycerate-independent phosphoglycerate mutase
MQKQTPLVLMILDGWGYREEYVHNAILQAHTPQWDEWWKNCPHALLEASGVSVGLPEGQMGNSEVGHMHIGAGRIISQDFTRINDAIAQGEYAQNPVFMKTIADMKQSQRALHVIGLLSPGGVHSHEAHLFAFIQLCAQQALAPVYLHLFLDGRDTPPQSAVQSLKKLQTVLAQCPNTTICSISGRYYAMDRDQRWQRIEPVYRLLTEGESPYHYPTAEEAITAFYQQKISDEFIPPTKIGEGHVIGDGDSIFFFNFRADRARQLTQAFIANDFQNFDRSLKPRIAHFISMTPYAKNLATENAFPLGNLTNTLGEVLAKQNLRQLRVAETEKYAHVTFFFNGGLEQAFSNEDRILIPSPKIATYDLQPEMSASELTKTIVDDLLKQTHDVIICNYANADMVGHSGKFDATIHAIEVLDRAMRDIGQALNKVGGQLLITADHGNAECMFDETTHQAHTAHTNAPVPFVYVGNGWHFNSDHGSLIDIAPTLLTLLGITPPIEMTGRALLVKDHV